jgi:hypothetical protein
MDDQQFKQMGALLDRRTCSIIQNAANAAAEAYAYLERGDTAKAKELLMGIKGALESTNILLKPETIEPPPTEETLPPEPSLLEKARKATRKYV